MICTNSKSPSSLDLMNFSNIFRDSASSSWPSIFSISLSMEGTNRTRSREESRGVVRRLRLRRRASTSEIRSSNLFLIAMISDFSFCTSLLSACWRRAWSFTCFDCSMLKRARSNDFSSVTVNVCFLGTLPSFQLGRKKTQLILCFSIILILSCQVIRRRIQL